MNPKPLLVNIEHLDRIFMVRSVQSRDFIADYLEACAGVCLRETETGRESQAVCISQSGTTTQ